MFYSLKRVIKGAIGLNYPYRYLWLKLFFYTLKNSNKKQLVPETIDIVLLTLNRIQDTKRTIKSLFKTKVRFNLIIIDQASNDGTLEYLKKLSLSNKNIVLVPLKKNLGVSGGRALAVQYLKSQFTAFIDNDMVFMPGYFQHLLSILKNNSKIAGVSAKVINPDGRIEINAPDFKIEKKEISFTDEDRGKFYWDPTTQNTKECAWLPMGASLWVTSILKDNPIDKDLIGAHEDNDYCFELWKKGFRFSNSPQSIVLHISARFTPNALADKNYTTGRFNTEKIRFSAKRFFEKHNLIFFFGDKEGFANYLDFSSAKEYRLYILKKLKRTSGDYKT